MKRVIIAVIALGASVISWGQTLDSRLGHGGEYSWKMARAAETGATAREMSAAGFDDSKWMDAIVPGTVLTSLVENGVYPEPYYGTNNKISEHKIPDIIDTGREFWTYWFRTEFDAPEVAEGERLWRLLPVPVGKRPVGQTSLHEQDRPLRRPLHRRALPGSLPHPRLPVHRPPERPVPPQSADRLPGHPDGAAPQRQVELRLPQGRSVEV